MPAKTVKIPAINCMHCVMTIKREIGALEGVKSVTGDAGTKQVTIEWDNPASWETIKAELADIGYPPED
jgi:copper chaperone